MKKKLLVMFVILCLLSGCRNARNTPDNDDKHSENNIVSGLRIMQADETTYIEANLCFAENITLRIDTSEIIVLSGTGDYNIDELRNLYTLVDAGHGVIAVVGRVPSVSGEYIFFELYKYSGEFISRVWSSKELSAQIQNVNIINGQIDLYFPQYDISHKLQFTENEQSRWEQKIAEFKNSNIKIDENYYITIKDNLIISPISYRIVDVKDSGTKEILILAEVKTVGAKTPSIRDQAVIKIKNANGAISMKDIVFEREPTEVQSPFAYFN